MNRIKKLIVKDELKDVLVEVFNLIMQLIFTMPSTRAFVDRSFPTMTRIKTIRRSSPSEDRLSALCLSVININWINIMLNLKKKKNSIMPLLMNLSKRREIQIKVSFLDSIPRLKSHRPPLIYTYWIFIDLLLLIKNYHSLICLIHNFPPTPTHPHTHAFKWILEFPKIFQMNKIKKKKKSIYKILLVSI